MSTEHTMFQDFFTRAVTQMHATGIIDEGAKERLLASPVPRDPYSYIGMLQALLGVAIWRDNAPTQPFRAGDTVEVLTGPFAGERWVIAVYEAATDTAHIAGWPYTSVTKASEALRLVAAATDEEHARMIEDVSKARGDHGERDPRPLVLQAVLAAGGTP